MSSFSWLEADIREYSWLRIMIEKRLIYLGDKVRVLNDLMKKELMRSHRIDSRNIFVAQVGFERQHKKWRPNGSSQVLYIGSFEPWQGVQTAIGAMEIIAEKSPEVRLVIIGGKGEPWEKGNVRYLGPMPMKELGRYYRESSCFLIPRDSIKITEIVTPMKLLEALSYGIPIIASDIGGIREIVRDRREALLVPPGNTKKLSAAIEELINNTSLQVELSKNGQKRFEDYTWEKVAKKIYNSLSIML